MYEKRGYVALFISALLHGLLLFFPWKETPIPSTRSSNPIGSISLIELPTLPAPPAPAISPASPTPAISSVSPAPVVPPAPSIAIPEDPLADLPPEDPSTETIDSPIDQPAPDIDPDIDLPPEDLSTETSDNPTNEPVPEADSDADLPPEDLSTETIDSPIDQTVPEADPDIDLPLEDPSTETIDSPTDELVSEADSDADLPPEEPSTETGDSPINDAKIAAEWENLVSHLQIQNQGFVYYDKLFDLFNTFGEPEQLNQFFDAEKDLKFDVSSFYHFPHQTPEQVLQTVVIPEIRGNTGFDLQPQENVSAGLAYQLSQGEMLRYLIIVQLNEGSGSVLMLSDSLLGLES